MLSVNIIFPVLNEEKRLERGIERTCRYMKENINNPYELTVVDNGSTDRTEEIGRRLCEIYPHVSYIKIAEKGVGAAFIAGVKNSRSDIAGYMDIDLSTDIRHLSDMLRIFETREDIFMVNASRLSKESETTGRKWYRNITSCGFAFLVRHSFHIKASDSICGFKFFRRDALLRLMEHSRTENGWFYLVELLVRAEKSGPGVYELPVRWQDDYNTTVHVGKLIAYYLRCIRRLKKDLKAES